MKDPTVTMTTATSPSPLRQWCLTFYRQRFCRQKRIQQVHNVVSVTTSKSFPRQLGSIARLSGLASMEGLA